MHSKVLQGIPTWVRSRSARRNLPLLLAVALVTFFASYSFLEPAPSKRPISQIGTHSPQQEHSKLPWHPIDDLIKEGEQQFRSLLAEQTHDVASAAAAYRKRRNRHPPPGFDKWFEYAQKNDAIIVEEFFDQIYHDISPFWALSPRWISQQAKNFEHVISVRRGKATYKTDKAKRVPWVPLWHDMVAGIAKDLPDVDMPVNVLDESRVLVPWERMNTFIQAEKVSRRLQPADTVTSEWSGIPGMPVERFDAKWTLNGPYWDIFRHTCPTRTEASNMSAIRDFSDLPVLPPKYPEHSYHGYVRNWTIAKSPCHNPHLQNIHGTFIEPTSIATTQELVPLFGGSKLQHNSEILIPPPAYWSKDAKYDPDGGTWSDWLDAFGWRIERPWAQKLNRILWRGVASGGRNRKENWTHFQRHRFVQMLNGSAVRGAGFAAGKRLQTTNLPFPENNPYNLTALNGESDERKGPLSEFGDWVAHYAAVAFTHLVCFPAESATDRWKITCPYSSPFYKVMNQLSRNTLLSSRYLPDIDGNSYSGRFLALLRSSSLPIKATIYSEWHDSRLIPWAHFVPIDNTFVDIYGVMEYFLGFEEGTSRDLAAERIASQGQEWANRVLRREDMRIYLWRVLIEFARVCDGERDRLGWVDDILETYRQ
ncbi:hypothetical protein NA57DRAFT_59463 [Rhizodiscina lignyota]|uniref:Glycosyl transferase CAP10 domain-containing protein n=1 Tax=Rhizodiscina lignyota TaxID=1504668 RepID=A0A9P4I7L7_9PEZI|nr:hypothetical protein NA57DRAFT_59463 [Rhizodiscina lignyota]